MDIIMEYNIGFTTKGDFAFRIIIPSYDEDGELNFFIARAFQRNTRPKYLNPEAEKQLIVFNEEKINWDATIYLFEGAFDHIVVPNSIPLLGKFISDLLFNLLQTKAKSLVVIVIDGDAWKDALLLYKQLNTLNLTDRVRIVQIREDLDISLIHERYNKKGIVSVLKNCRKIQESELY